MATKSKQEKSFFDEIILTFSNKKSLLSSKKIERFIVFNVFLALTVFYVYKKIDILDATSFMQIIGIWLFYGGYNSLMSLKDKKLDQESAPAEPTSEDPAPEETAG